MTSKPHPQRLDSESTPPPHPLLQHPEFLPSNSFNPFWNDTWGKPYSEVFTSFEYGGRPYNVLLSFPPTRGDPESYSFTSETEGILMLSEYQDLWTDLQSELNGVHKLPTLARSDPSPWDHWNELDGKPWRDGFFRNEDGSPVLTDPHSQLESGYDAVGDKDGDATIEALKRLKRPRRKVPYRATFRVFQILGQPGIGKSMSLYVILAQRLMAQKPTFFQNKPGVVVFFCSTGAYEVRVTEEPDWGEKLTEEELFLFDSNETVLQPATFWRFFPVPIVEAVFPRPQSTYWARKMTVKEWYMRPMSLNEFLVASRFQSQEIDKTRLAVFYTKYGPNARQAYHQCRHPDGLEEHMQGIRFKLPSEKLSSMITEYSSHLNPNSVSHFIKLITAGPTRYSYRSGFISRDVFQLVREQYEKDKNHRIEDLFLYLNSQSTTRATAGYIFEDSMHRILKKGVCLQLRKMRDSGTGKQANAIYIIDHPAEWLQVGPTIQLSERRDLTVGPLPFQFYDHTEVLHRGVYGQPTHPINAAFNAYFWNETQKTVWMLQFTVSDEHDVKPSGVKWIKDRIPDDVEIRFVVFSPEEHVRLRVPKTITEITYLYHVHIPDLELLVQE